MTEIMAKLNARDRTHAVPTAIANRFLQFTGSWI